jgi:hypothetical protein
MLPTAFSLVKADFVVGQGRKSGIGGYIVLFLIGSNHFRQPASYARIQFRRRDPHSSLIVTNRIIEIDPANPYPGFG